MSDYIHDEKIKELEILANKIRQSLIEELVEAKSGHTAGPLGMADVFTAMYFHVLNHDPKNPDWRRRFCFSAETARAPIVKISANSKISRLVF